MRDVGKLNKKAKKLSINTIQCIVFFMKSIACVREHQSLAIIHTVYSRTRSYRQEDICQFETGDPFSKQRSLGELASIYLNTILYNVHTGSRQKFSVTTYCIMLVGPGRVELAGAQNLLKALLFCSSFH